MQDHGDRRLSREMVDKPFHDDGLMRDIWSSRWGARNAVGRVRTLLMHRPGREIELLRGNAHELEAGSVFMGKIEGRSPNTWATGELPDPDKLAEQHDALAAACRREGIAVVELGGDEQSLPERMFTRDLGMAVPGGIVIGRFALRSRYGESRLAMETLAREGVPIVGMIQGDGFVEGGSFTWLDEKTALIGRSERVNPAGIEQLRAILALQGVELVVLDLPATIIHLDEAFLMLDRDKALINIALLPYWFIDLLHRRGFKLFHVDPDDPPLSINALTVSPGRVIFPASGRRTMELLDRAGIELIPVDVSEFYKLGGGIHCASLALLRDDLPPATQARYTCM